MCRCFFHQGVIFKTGNSKDTLPWAFNIAALFWYRLAYSSLSVWSPLNCCLCVFSSHRIWSVACSYPSSPPDYFTLLECPFFISYFLLSLLHLPLCDLCATEAPLLKKMGSFLCVCACMCVCLPSRSLKRTSFDLFLHFTVCVRRIERLLTHLVMFVCVCLCACVCMFSLKLGGVVLSLGWMKQVLSYLWLASHADWRCYNIQP